MPTKYFMAGGVNSNWNTNGNWSTVSSAGPADTTFATIADDVVFDVGSPACTVNTTSAALSINFTGYIATITMSGTLNVAGAITLGVGMSETGTGQLRATTTATLTSAGHTWSGNFMFAGTSQTYTLADAWVVGTLLMGGGGTNIVNSQTLSAGGLSVSSGLSGTTPITLTGGTWSGTGSFSVSSNLTIAGDVTLSGTVRYGALAAGSSTLTYGSGTVTTTGSTLEIQGSSGTTTLDCNGLGFNAITMTANSNNIALASNLQAVTLTWAQNTDVIFTGAGAWTVDYLTAPNTNTGNKTMTLVQANTYTVTTAMTVQGASATFYRTIASSSGTLKVPLILNNGAGQDVRYVKATRVDSSGGQTIHSYGIAAADISTSLNWDIVGGGFMWLG